MRRLPRTKRQLEGEDGAILVLAAVLLIVLFGVAALAIDITLKSTDRQQLWNSSDAAALAGAALLPDGVAAEAQALDTALANDDQLAGNIATSFRCLVADRDGNGVPDLGEVGAGGACNPAVGITQGIPDAEPPIAGGWTCADNVCSAVCVPAAGDSCNTIVLGTRATTDFAFAPAVGVESADTSISSAACRGTCGTGLTGPVDLIIVIDRSGSMSEVDALNVRDASLAMLEFFDPAIQRVGLAVLPPADPTNECSPVDPTRPSSEPNVWRDGRWLIVPLSNDFKDDADALDQNSELVQRINCATHSGYTDLGSPIRDAAATTSAANDDALWELSHGPDQRADVRKGILFLSDGSANQPYTETNPCRFARDQAVYARNSDLEVEIFTIGFGVESARCTVDVDPPYGGGAPVTELLADMASQPSFDNCIVGNTDVENNDNDHFFCVPKSEDLTTVFLAIAAQLAEGSRLVQLPPGA